MEKGKEVRARRQSQKAEARGFGKRKL
jgi:hypothetical protein